MRLSDENRRIGSAIFGVSPTKEVITIDLENQENTDPSPVKSKSYVKPAGGKQVPKNTLSVFSSPAPKIRSPLSEKVNVPLPPVPPADDGASVTSSASKSDFLKKHSPSKASPVLEAPTVTVPGTGNVPEGVTESVSASVLVQEKLTPRKIFTVLQSTTPAPAATSKEPVDVTKSALPPPPQNQLPQRRPSARSGNAAADTTDVDSAIAGITSSINSTLSSLRASKKAANEKKRREIQELKMERLREKIESERYNKEAAKTKKEVRWGGIRGWIGESEGDQS